MRSPLLADDPSGRRSPPAATDCRFRLPAAVRSRESRLPHSMKGDTRRTFERVAEATPTLARVESHRGRRPDRRTSRQRTGRRRGLPRQPRLTATLCASWAALSLRARCVSRRGARWDRPDQHLVSPIDWEPRRRCCMHRSIPRLQVGCTRRSRNATCVNARARPGWTASGSARLGTNRPVAFRNAHDAPALEAFASRGACTPPLAAPTPAPPSSGITITARRFHVWRRKSRTAVL